MIWLNPSALFALGALAVPLAVHLLVRQRAVHVLFPSLRFLRPTATIAIRLRSISDWPLLLIRIGIVAAAALAVARPLLLTDARRQTWNARITRVSVIDTSESLHQPAPATGNAAAPSAVAALEASRAGAWRHQTIETASLRRGLDEAVALLRREPPARREIVLISDFQRHALSEADIRAVPADIGIRFERAARRPAEAAGAGVPLVVRSGGGTLSSWVPEVRIDPRWTTVSYRPAGPVEAGADAAPVTVLAPPGERAAAERLATASIAGGITQVAAGRRAIVVLGEALVTGDAAPPAAPTGWTAAALFRLSTDRVLQSLAPREEIPHLEHPEAGPWTTLVRGVGERPIVRGAARAGSGQEVLVVTNAPASSFFAFTLVNAIWRALAPPDSLAELEVVTVSDADLARWTRQPPSSPATAVPGADDSESRWLWTAALALCVAEMVARRSSPAAQAQQESARAA